MTANLVKKSSVRSRDRTSMHPNWQGARTTATGPSTVIEGRRWSVL